VIISAEKEKNENKFPNVGVGHTLEISNVLPSSTLGISNVCSCPTLETVKIFFSLVVKLINK
jgi:hypothetical protein